LITSRVPAFRDDLISVYLGDAGEVLRDLPAASIDCVVTSPPYWGLRDYSLEPIAWGGDPACHHAWGEWSEPQDERETAGLGKSRTNGRFYGDPTGRLNGNYQRRRAGASCRRCGAWRGCLGLEPTPDLYVEHMVEVFREVRRVLRPTGTLWLNLGDAYCAGTRTDRRPTTRSGVAVPSSWSARCQPLRIGALSNLKPKDLVGLPWRVAFGLQNDGWYLRADIIWAKPNPMPESVRDRPTKAHEYLFLLSPSGRYFYDAEAVREAAVTGVLKAPAGWDRAPGGHGTIHRLGREPRIGADRKALAGPTYARHRAAVPGGQSLTFRSGRNRRTVWNVATQPYSGAHFATFPERLVEPCILAGTSEWGCCSGCGAPWRREVEVGYDNPGNRSTNGPRSLARRADTPGFAVRLERHARTVGWTPTCECDAPARPAIVLDPFAGSGTTLAVAARLGRRAVGAELSPAYIDLIRQRCAQPLLRRAS